MRAFEEQFLVDNFGLDWSWPQLDLSSDARPCFMSRENSGTISSTTTRSRHATGASRIAPLIWPLLAGFARLSAFRALFYYHPHDFKLPAHPGTARPQHCCSPRIHP